MSGIDTPGAETTDVPDAGTREGVARVVGFGIAARGFEAEEDHGRVLSPGVYWRRQRFRFTVEGTESEEALCINELTIDPAHARIEPVLAMDHDYLNDAQEIADTYWAVYHADGAIRKSSGLRSPRLFLRMAGLLRGEASHPYDTWRQLSEWGHREIGGPMLSMVAEDLADLEPVIEEGHNPTGRAAMIRWLPAIPASRLVQSRRELIAVTAAGFYLNFPEEFGDAWSSLHEPIGALAVDGALRTPAWLRRPGFAGFADGSGVLAMLGPEQMKLELNGGLHEVALHGGIPHGPEHGAVWLRWNAEPPKPREARARLVFSSRRLIEWGPADAAPAIPLGGAMVWLCGAAADAVLAWPRESPAAALKFVKPFDRADWIASGAPVLLRGGSPIPPDAMLTPENAGDFSYPHLPPTRFPREAATNRAPRTALGVTHSGLWKIIVVDGRRSGEHSIGLSLDGLAQLCLQRGCRDAVNMDGGGSAVMALEGVSRSEELSDAMPVGVVNLPSDRGGKERLLPVFLSVVDRDGNGADE